MRIGIWFSILIIHFTGFAALTLTNDFNQQILVDLSKRYLDSKVELTENPKLITGQEIKNVKQVQYLGDNYKGEAYFRVIGINYEQAEYLVRFSAWKKVRVANRRIKPGEPLKEESFNIQEVNLASGSAHDQKGLMVSLETDISKLEAIQTILETQYLLSSAVRQIPDIKKGDFLKIKLISPHLLLTLSGMALEPGNIGSTIRVMTSSTKKELMGKLLEDNNIEVKL